MKSLWIPNGNPLPSFHFIFWATNVITPKLETLLLGKEQQSSVVQVQSDLHLFFSPLKRHASFLTYCSRITEQSITIDFAELCMCSGWERERLWEQPRLNAKHVNIDCHVFCRHTVAVWWGNYLTRRHVFLLKAHKIKLKPWIFYEFHNTDVHQCTRHFTWLVTLFLVKFNSRYRKKNIGTMKHNST